MNLLEARELLKNKGYTVRRLNECGSYSGGCSGSSSYSSGCGSSGCGSSYSSGCGSSSSYGGGCGTISRSVRVGCGYVSSCHSSGCGSYYYDDDEDETPATIIVKNKRYEFTGYNSYYGCAEYKNPKTGKIIININESNDYSKFTKIYKLARKIKTSEIRTVEIIETLYESGISREVAYTLLSKLNILPDKLLRLPITHVKPSI
jgi:hypothetical protein